MFKIARAAHHVGGLHSTFCPAASFVPFLTLEQKEFVRFQEEEQDRRKQALQKFENIMGDINEKVAASAAEKERTDKENAMCVCFSFRSLLR